MNDNVIDNVFSLFLLTQKWVAWGFLSGGAKNTDKERCSETGFLLLGEKLARGTTTRQNTMLKTDEKIILTQYFPNFWWGGGKEMCSIKVFFGKNIWNKLVSSKCRNVCPDPLSYLIKPHALTKSFLSNSGHRHPRTHLHLINMQHDTSTGERTYSRIQNGVYILQTK